jgi:hypothetical protein
MTARAQLYRAFWDRFLEQVRVKHPTWTRATTSKSSWIAMSAGVAYVNWVFSFAEDGLGVQLEFVNQDPIVNLARFDALQSRGAELETAFGAQLRWDRMEGLKATKVAVRGEIANVADEPRWDEWIEWLIDVGERFRTALGSVGGVPTA